MSKPKRRSKKSPASKPPAGVLRKALAKSACLTASIQSGKQAFEGIDRPRVNESGAEVTDSLALDKLYRTEQPQAARWDYLAGVRVTKPAAECLYGIEVHPATPGEVGRVIQKKQNAMNTLEAELGTDPVHRWVWIASGKVDIPQTTREFKLLLKNDIRLVGHLIIQSC